jgi:hypothetical protein
MGRRRQALTRGARRPAHDSLSFAGREVPVERGQPSRDDMMAGDSVLRSGVARIARVHEERGAWAQDDDHQV